MESKVGGNKGSMCVNEEACISEVSKFNGCNLRTSWADATLYVTKY